MILTYDYFVKKLNEKIKSDADFYYELLVNVIDNPHRYTGIFRLSNAKTKLVQNVTQSREIKFGDFMEDIVTMYIDKMGYTNLNKSIGTDEEGNALSADQVFINGDTVYLIEQKIRDDHDSTKKRGQYDNFRKKYTLLEKKYPDKKVNASMWFIDGSLVKNKKYYIAESQKENSPRRVLNVFYGEALFSQLFDRPNVWEELTSYLQKNKLERNNEILTIPDFDTSDEMLVALKRLKKENAGKYRKLISDKPEYIQLRTELFTNNINLNRVKEEF